MRPDSYFRYGRSFLFSTIIYNSFAFRQDNIFWVRSQFRRFELETLVFIAFTVSSLEFMERKAGGQFLGGDRTWWFFKAVR